MNLKTLGHFYGEQEKRVLKDTIDINQTEGDTINLKKNILGSDVLFQFRNSFFTILVIK